MKSLEEQHTADLQTVSLNKLVLVQHFDREGNVKMMGSPQVLWYKPSLNVLKMARDMHKLHHSDLILSSWAKRAASLAVTHAIPSPVQMTLTQVCENIWSPLLREFSLLGGSIAEADITFEQLDRVLDESGDQGDGELMKKELSLMAEMISAAGDEGNWVELRLGQIQEYQLLREAAAAAGAVLRVAQKMKLSGDFSEIHTISQLVIV